MFYGLTSAAGKSLVDSLKDLWNSTGFVANDFAYYENYHFGIWGLERAAAWLWKHPF